MTYTFWVPPDTQGVAGPAHLVSALNGGFAIFDKATGAVVYGPIPLYQFWGPILFSGLFPFEFPFDPKVLYDEYSGRFIVVSDAGELTTNSWVLVAISNGSDPTLGFTEFAIDANGSVPEAADYPGVGLDGRSVYITNNMYRLQPFPSFNEYRLWVIDKASMLSGGPLTVSEFDNAFKGSTWQPAHAFGPTSVNYLVSQGYVAGQTRQYFRILQVSYPSGSPVVSDRGFVQVADYGFTQFMDAPQPSCSTLIDMFDARLLTALLRDGHLWTTHHVDQPALDGSGKKEVAWYEIDPLQAGPCQTKATCAGPIQQGRVGDPNLWYFYPSIAVNGRGDVALGFSGSDASTFASAYYTERLASDPPGTMRAVQPLQAGRSPYLGVFDGRNRWGDFSATVVDPSDDWTFWTLQELADVEADPGCPTNFTGRWATWWGSFR